jgi:uncharacterized protein (DUF302 family)
MPEFLAVVSGEHMKILAMVLAIVAALITAFDAVAVAAPRTTVLAGSVVFGQFTYVTRPTLLGFPDFTTVRAEWDGRGARLVIFARSRFRVSDFGANPCLWDGITESLERWRCLSRPAIVASLIQIHQTSTFIEFEIGSSKMRLLQAISATIFILSACQSYAAELIRKQSPHTVSVTIDRLAAAVEGAGATVFARVDHAAGASSVGMELRPTQLLIFGNPKLGTPALQAGQTAGLDLPLRVVAYKDDSGQVFLAYHSPSILAADHGIPADAEVLKKMTGALDKLTSNAIAQ